MSSDNYCHIVEDKPDHFKVYHGFVSDGEMNRARLIGEADSITTAADIAAKQYPEYGISYERQFS